MPSPVRLHETSHRLRLRPDLGEVAQVRAFLRDLAGRLAFSAERTFDMQVAVGEAVANAIEHAHGTGEVLVEARVLADRLEVSIQGTGEFHLPAQADSREHRGLGLPLMATLSDHLALYSRAEGGTLVTLTFYLAGRQGPDSSLPPSLLEQLAQNSLLDEVLANISDAFAVYDSDWQIVYLNAQAAERLGRSREELLGEVVWDHLPAFIDRTCHEEWHRAAREQGMVTCEEHDPELGRWYEDRAFPFGGGVAVFSREITERKRMERELRESEVRYRSLFQNMVEGFAYCRMIFEDGAPADFEYLAVNRAFYTLTGLPEVIGRRVTEIIPGIRDTNPAIFDIYGRVSLTGEPESYEDYFPALGIWLSVSVYSIEQGTFVAVFENVTERKQAEERLQEENREITLANRVLRIFAEEADEDVFDKALAVVQEGMASRHGVFGYIPEPGHLFCPSLSKMLDACEIEGKCIHYPPEKWKGLWARALREKRSFFTNEAPPVPRGHPIIHSNLAAPILFRGESIGLLNLANRDGGYTEGDRQSLDGIATRVAPVLYAWIQRKLREDERQAAEEAVRASEEQLRVAALAGEIGMWSWVPGTNTFTVSANWRGLFGVEAEAEITFAKWVERLHAEDRERTVAELRAAAAEHRDFHAEYRVVRRDGSVRWLVDRGRASDDAGGRAVQMAGVNIDITDRKQAEAELVRLHAQEQRAGALAAALAELERGLHRSFDTKELVQRALVGAAEALGAERAALNLRELGGFRMAHVHGWPPEMLGSLYPEERMSLASLVLKTGETLALDDAFHDGRVSPELMKEYGTTSVIAAPLLLRGEALGVLYLSYTRTFHHFTSAEVDFVGKLASSLSLALENARLYQSTSSVAETLQEALVFAPPAVQGVRFGHAYRSASESARLGGDFFDVFGLPNGEVGVIVGDVSGKGLEAAYLASFTREAIRAYALHDGSPRHILHLANKALIHRHGTNHFVTVALILLEPATGRLKYSLAGHPPPVCVSPLETQVTTWKGCPPLGVFEDARFVTGRFRLERDATLVFFTDGITDTRREGQLLGERGLVELLERLELKAPEVISERLMTEVSEYGGGTFRDDAAVLALRLA